MRLCVDEVLLVAAEEFGGLTQQVGKSGEVK